MIGKDEIQEYVPHREPMALVDEIREYTPTSGVGIHHVRDDEFWVAGHFPQKSIMPGILQVEALAQVACFLVIKDLVANGGEKKLGYFTTMEKIRFFHMVRPGDTLELHVELIAHKMKLYKFRGMAMVRGMKVAEATFSAIMDDMPA